MTTQTELNKRHTLKVITWASMLHKLWMSLSAAPRTRSGTASCNIVLQLQIIYKFHLIQKSLTFFFLLFPCSMSRHHQPSEPSGYQRWPLPEHGEDLQQLHGGPGEPGNHLHGGAPRPVLPQGKDGCTAKHAHHTSAEAIFFFRWTAAGLRDNLSRISASSYHGSADN